MPCPFAASPRFAARVLFFARRPLPPVFLPSTLQPLLTPPLLPNPLTGSFHKLILQHEAFKSGNVDTGFIPKYADELTTPPKESKTKAFMTEVAKARKGTKK